MLEMHQLTRYEHAPVVIFGPRYDPTNDAQAFFKWLSDFCLNRTRPPKLLLFTFRATDSNEDDACRFMKAVLGDPETAKTLTGIKIQLDFGEMSPDVAARAHERILSQRF